MIGSLLPTRLARMAAVWLCGLASVVPAAELAEVLACRELVWAADQEGGGPHVFPDPKNPEQVKGFEVDLAAMLALEISRASGGRSVHSRMQQGQWDRLPLLVGRVADCVLNGIELTPERQRDYHCSRPYFAYGLQLLSRRDGPLVSLEKFTAPGPTGRWKVGVLTGSAAESFMRNRIDFQIDVIGYDGTIDCMEQVTSGVLDATVLDDCIASFYADRFVHLRAVGRPFAGGFYTILTARDTPHLSAAIDVALGRMIAGGGLEELYDRWDLAGRQQILLLRDATEIPPAQQRSLLELAHDSLPLLMASAGMTVLLSFAAMPLAIAIGLSLAIGRLYGPLALRPFMAGYVELLRGTPLMLQLYAIFFLLPKIGLALPALVAAIAGLALNYSAYESEIYRAGLKAVPGGQFEAALSLGMTKWQALRHVIVPQAVRIVMPPVTNDFIALFKDTSVCSVITVIELTKRYSVLALSTGRIMELAIVTALLYLAMSWPLSLLSHWFEHRLAQRGSPFGKA